MEDKHGQVPWEEFARVDKALPSPSRLVLPNLPAQREYGLGELAVGMRVSNTSARPEGPDHRGAGRLAPLGDPGAVPVR